MCKIKSCHAKRLLLRVIRWILHISLHKFDRKRKSNSVPHFVLKCVKCVARPSFSFSGTDEVLSACSGSTTQHYWSTSLYTETRWRSQRAAWKPLYFHPVQKKKADAKESVSFVHKSCVNSGRSQCGKIYLLAGFYEFIYSHHSVSVPIHFLKNVRHEKLYLFGFQFANCIKLYSE